jgi:hypothetical protein
MPLRLSLALSSDRDPRACRFLRPRPKLEFPVPWHCVPVGPSRPGQTLVFLNGVRIDTHAWMSRHGLGEKLTGRQSAGEQLRTTLPAILKPPLNVRAPRTKKWPEGQVP